MNTHFEQFHLYGEAINHPATYDFIANELLTYGSYIGNFCDNNQQYIRVLISYPRALFGHKPHIFVTLGEYGTQAIALDNYRLLSEQNIISQFHIPTENIDYTNLVEFLNQIIQRLI
jgi:hypothetical protein